MECHIFLVDGLDAIDFIMADPIVRFGGRGDKPEQVRLVAQLVGIDIFRFQSGVTGPHVIGVHPGFEGFQVPASGPIDPAAVTGHHLRDTGEIVGRMQGRKIIPPINGKRLSTAGQGRTISRKVYSPRIPN